MDIKAVTNAFTQATIKVFEMMLGIRPKPGKPFIKKGTETYGDFSAYVMFVQDTMPKGTMTLSLTEEAAVFCTMTLFGDLEEGCGGVVGELTNIISGDVRRCLSEVGRTYQGSTPTVLEGKMNKVPQVEKAVTIVIPFQLSEGTFVLETTLTA